MRDFFIKSIPYVFIMLGFVIAYWMIANNTIQSKENNGYTRVINCIISKNATERIQSDIEECYRVVENEIGIKLQRYDK